MTLVPLFDLTQQFNNKNGAVLVGGKLYVYYVGRTDLATTWADEDAQATNTNPVLLDNNGRAPCFVDDSYSYTLVVCDRNGQELFSQDITPGGAGSVGGRVVYHDDTLTGAGTVASLLGVANIPLGVDETMTAYTGVVDNKDALILGVNGDWFNDTFGSALNDKVDWSSFSACCSAVKGGLDNKLDASAINNYYTKNEVNERTSSFVNYNFLSSNYYTKYETSALFQEKLTFGYDANSAISSINNSALAGGGGAGDYTPWISGTKHIAETQLMTDNMLIQVLSSFDLSGNKNHCINVKGGMYRFPNQWEIASSVQNTNWFMEKSAMSGYFPTSSFNSFIENGFNPNINALYSSASNLIYSGNWLINNKLDISAFSAYTADAGETYTLVGGNDISISSDDVNQTTTISFTGSTGDVEVNTTVQNNSATWNNVTNKLDTTAFSTVSGSFLTAHQSLEDYYKKTETSSKEEISAAIAAIPLGDVEVNNVVHTNSGVWNNKLDATAYHELTAGTNIDIQNYVISSKDWTNEIKEASANAFNEATAANPTSSTQWNSCYETVNTNSGEWQKVSGKLDTTAFESYTANDETYLLKGGYNIGVSSDDVNKETTIYYTGTNGDEQVNQVVRQYSAAGTWLTSHQDWTNTITAASAYAYSQATAQIPAPFDPTYISGQIDNKLNKSESANYYPMTGNPSGFLTTETDWTNVITAASSYAYNQATAHEPDMSLYVPMSAVSALIDVVQTYSGKWLLNGDL